MARDAAGQPSIDDALAAVLYPGQTIVIGQGMGSPRALIAALPRHLERLQGSTLHVGWLLADFPELPGTRIESFFPSGVFGTDAGMVARNARYCRRSLFDYADELRRGAISVDVALALAAPERTGRHSLGISVDYIHPAVEQAGAVVLEISATVPWTGESSTVAIAPHVLATWNADGPLASTSTTSRADPDGGTAAHLLDWIPDGATLEFGIGKWLDPAISLLADHRRGLRLHSGSVGPWLLPLLQSGAIADDVPIVSTAAAGDRQFYSWLEDERRVALAPAHITHNPATLASMPCFRAINSVLEIDLLGRANCEAAGGRLGGVGGLPDFARAAASSPDGLSIIVLPATSRGISRIVPQIAIEPPSLDSSDIDIVVTEHGSADLRGLSMADRAAALIAIAAPQFRTQLRAQADETGIG